MIANLTSMHLARWHGKLSSVGMLGLVLVAAMLVACRDEPEEEPAEPAVLVDSVTFEVGEQAKVSQQTGEDDAIRHSTEIVRSGAAASEAILRVGDSQFQGRTGFRSEWQSDFYAKLSQDYWYGFSVYLPEDWNQGTNPFTFDDRIIFQFHEGTGSSPALSLHIRADEGRLMVRRRTDDDFDYLWSIPFETDRWYDFAFHTRWSHGEDGLVEIFLDGELVKTYEGPTLVDGETIYTKWGIYGQPSHVFHDAVKIAEGVAGGMDVVSPD